MGCVTNCSAFRGAGALLGAVSGIFYSLCATLGKLLGGNVDPIMISWCTNVSLVLSSVLLILITRGKPWSYGPKDWAKVASLGILTVIFQVMQYKTFQMIDLSEAITLTSLSPLFIILIEFFINCQRCKVMDIFVLVISLVGVVCCAQPSFIFGSGKSLSTQQWVGYALALAVALTWALFFIAIEKLKHVDLGTLLLIHDTVSLALVSIAAAIFQEFDNFVNEESILYLSLLCVLYVFAAFFSCISVIIDNPLFASIGRTADIAVSFLINCVVFHTYANGISIFGSILIMLAIIIPTVVLLFTNRENAEPYQSL